MKSGLFNRSLADRGARLAGVPFNRSHSTVGADATGLSPLTSSPACGKTVLPSPLPGSTVALPQHAMIMVRAVAAYERCDNDRAITMALADYVQKIGAGPLARAVLDAEQDVSPKPAAMAVPFIAGDDEDIADVPAFARVGENRFRDGGP